MNNNYKLYSSYKKPSWAPPAFLFAPVWTFLYILIAISFGSIFYMWFKNEIPFFVVLPFVLNLIFNFLFTPLEFGLKKHILAGIDVVLTLVTLLWASIIIYPYFHWIFYFQIPYILWVSFASILQWVVIYINRK